MSRSTAIVDREMRKEGYVSASVTCAQYGITRSQLIDIVLQGKVKPRKPESGAAFYVSWSDCVAVLGTPKEFRSNPRRILETEVIEDTEPEILLDGMIANHELDDLYRKQAVLRAQNKQRAAEISQHEKHAARIVSRPANPEGDPDFDDDVAPSRSRLSDDDLPI